MEKTEFRVLIKHCFLMGKNTVQAKQWIEKCYPDSCPSKATICRWFAEFKRGRTDTNDAERSGRPVEAVMLENVSEVTKIIMKDRKVKLRGIAEMTQISYGSVEVIFNESDESSSKQGDDEENPPEDRLLTVAPESSQDRLNATQDAKSSNDETPRPRKRPRKSSPQSDDKPPDVDDSSWNLMGAALEREFLAQD